MRSISLSLLVCILALLVLSLLTVSGLVFHEAQSSLEAKKRSMKGHLEAQHKASKLAEVQKVNEALLADVRHIRSLVKLQVEFPEGPKLRLYSLGALAALTAPEGYLS